MSKRMTNGSALASVNHSGMIHANTSSPETRLESSTMGLISNSTSTPVKRKRRKISAGEASSLTCVVCGSQAFGYNFDVISCESCKAFFRRNADKGVSRLSRCQKDGCCPITSFSRKHCPACRMKKCLASGMRKELITPMEKLKNRANYRGKRHERKMQAKHAEEESNRSVNSDDSKGDASMHQAWTSGEDAEAREEVVTTNTSPPSPATSTSAHLPDSSVAPAVKQEAGVSTSTPAPAPAALASPTLADKLPPHMASLPAHILEKIRTMPPELLAKFSQAGAGRASAFAQQQQQQPVAGASIDEHAMARQCTMTWYRERSGQPAPVKEESPPPDPSSLMGAMHAGGTPGSLPTSPAATAAAAAAAAAASGGLEMNHAALFLDLIKAMPVTEAPPGHSSCLREDIFAELFNSIKAGFINIAKPLKKAEIIRTHLSEMPNSLEGSFNHMENMVRRVIAVLKCLPQFVVLSRDIQIALLKRSIHGLFAFCGALAYDTSQNAIRIVYEEESGEIKSFYLNFSLYVTQGLKDIQATEWASKEGFGFDKVNELIRVNQIVFNRITTFTKGDHLLIMSLMCLRFFRESVEQLKEEGISVNEGMQWVMQRTRTEMYLFIREYVARKWPGEDAEKNYQNIVSLFDSIQQLERAGEMLSRVVCVDNLNPLMREFLMLPRPPSPDEGEPSGPGPGGR